MKDLVVSLATIIATCVGLSGGPALAQGAGWTPWQQGAYNLCGCGDCSFAGTWGLVQGTPSNTGIRISMESMNLDCCYAGAYILYSVPTSWRGLCIDGPPAFVKLKPQPVGAWWGGGQVYRNFFAYAGQGQPLTGPGAVHGFLGGGSNLWGCAACSGTWGVGVEIGNGMNEHLVPVVSSIPFLQGAHDVSFGSVAVGNAGLRYLALSNSGPPSSQITVTISGPLHGTGSFAIDEHGPFTLQGGEQRRVRLRYVPTIDQLRNANWPAVESDSFTITTNTPITCAQVQTYQLSASPEYPTPIGFEPIRCRGSYVWLSEGVWVTYGWRSSTGRLADLIDGCIVEQLTMDCGQGDPFANCPRPIGGCVAGNPEPVCGTSIGADFSCDAVVLPPPFTSAAGGSFAMRTWANGELERGDAGGFTDGHGSWGERVCPGPNGYLAPASATITQTYYWSAPWLSAPQPLRTAHVTHGVEQRGAEWVYYIAKDDCTSQYVATLPTGSCWP